MNSVFEIVSEISEFPRLFILLINRLASSFFEADSVLLHECLFQRGHPKPFPQAWGYHQKRPLVVARELSQSKFLFYFFENLAYISLIFEGAVKLIRLQISRNS